MLHEYSNSDHDTMKMKDSGCYCSPLYVHVRLSVSLSVCVCVCVSVREHISETTRPIFTSSVRVTDGRGSVLLWRCCDTLCPTCFMGHVTFAPSCRE